MADDRSTLVLEVLRSGLRDLAAAAGESPGLIEGDGHPWQVVEARRLAAGGVQPPIAQAGQLLSPFCGLGGYVSTARLPLKELDPSDADAIFPNTVLVAQPAGEIKLLWKAFDAAWREYLAAAPDNVHGQIETLLALLQKYAWSVPSGVDGVSVYDLARTSAAVVACLPTAPDAHLSEGPLALLVSGDISGLQKFLYTLASEGAARSLRARSVYLQWLAEAIAFSLLADLKLPLSSLLYVGGGGFQFLAPPEASGRLANLAAELGDRLLTLHNGGLGITLAWEELTLADFTRFSGARDRLGKKLNPAKRRPFAAMETTDLLRSIGVPVSQGGDPLKFCRVTGEDGATVEGEGETCKAKFVTDLEALGRQLPYATHLAFVMGEKGKPARAVSWQQALAVFGMRAELVTERKRPEDWKLPAGLWCVWRFRPKYEQGMEQWLGRLPKDRVLSYQPLAQLTAMTPDGPKTFDELAESVNGGFQRWGVLRMDIDNLGDLFKSGYGATDSLARSSGLSFALRLFFEGWLPQLAFGRKDAAEPMQRYNLSEYLYLQYSGGDDLFVVGAWDVLPEFARRIRCSLSVFAAGNPRVTLSAGIDLFPAKFPLYQAARRTEEAEKAAKNFKRENGPPKDAITFLGETLDWQDFEAVQTLAYRIASLVGNGALARSVMQSVLTLNALIEQRRQADYRKWVQNAANRGKPYPRGKIRFGPWTWLAAYQLTRVKQQIPRHHPRHDEAENLVNQLQAVYLNPRNDFQIQTNGLAARWAQFLTRGG